MDLDLPAVDAPGGQIQLVIGPMFSGKSSELLRRIRRYTIAKRTCIVIKYSKDTRVQWTAVPAVELAEVKANALNFDVIGIDEGQFFPDVVEFAEEMADSGKIVVIAALDGTFQRQPFVNVINLIPLSEHITKLTAVCMGCQRDAAFTMRVTAETQVEVIGGVDKYASVCRYCYHKYKDNPTIMHN